MKKLIALAVIGVLSTSCVTTRVHKKLQLKYDLLTTEADQLRQKNELSVLRKIPSSIERLVSEMRGKLLRADTTTKFDELRALRTKYDRLSKQYDYLLDNNTTLIAASARENKMLMNDISAIQRRLQAKEDSLNTERRKLERGRLRVSELEGVIRRKRQHCKFRASKSSGRFTGFHG